jgi:hypothetical protein
MADVTYEFVGKPLSAPHLTTKEPVYLLARYMDNSLALFLKEEETYASIRLSVNLGPGQTPPPNSIYIPAYGHCAGLAKALEAAEVATTGDPVLIGHSEGVLMTFTFDAEALVAPIPVEERSSF